MSIKGISNRLPVLGYFLIIILIFSVALSQDINKSPGDSATKYKFNYRDGDRPWENHIPTQPTTTFEELLKKIPSMRHSTCNGDSTDFDESQCRIITGVCVQGKGAKMVVPLGYPTWTYEVCISPDSGGLFERAHYLGDIPGHFYNHTSKPTVIYFILPFEDYEIPVFSVDEPMTFLPMWKNLFMARNGMDEDYFDAHIRVVGAYVDETRPKGEVLDYFNVEYYYYFDWARLKLKDHFIIKDSCCNLADMLDTLDYEKSFQIFKETLNFDNYLKDSLGWIKLSKIQPIDSIILKNQVVETVSSVSPLLGFDVNTSFRLSPNGELTLGLWGILDWEQNECLTASMNLVNGKMTKVSEYECRVY